MPHRDFDAVRRAQAAAGAGETVDPVSFTYGGEDFTVLPDPSLGDTFDLADAPEIDPATFDPENSSDLEAVRILARFIERMLPPEDRARWQRAHYRIPSREAWIVVECADYIVQQVANRPSEPSRDSSPPPASSGRRSKKKSGGSTRSRTSPRGSRSR